MSWSSRDRRRLISASSGCRARQHRSVSSAQLLLHSGQIGFEGGQPLKVTSCQSGHSGSSQPTDLRSGTIDDWSSNSPLLFVGVIGCGQFALGIGDRVPASLKKNLSIGRRAALVQPEVNGQGEARDGSMGWRPQRPECRSKAHSHSRSATPVVAVTIFIVIPPFEPSP